MTYRTDLGQPFTRHISGNSNGCYIFATRLNVSPLFDRITPNRKAQLDFGAPNLDTFQRYS